MLTFGRLTVTITSKKTGQHVTLRLRCKQKSDRSWSDPVPFAEASHVLIHDYDFERVATYHAKTATLIFERNADDASRWATAALFRYLAGEKDLAELAEIVADDLCGNCGLPLPDDDQAALERGFDDDCFERISRDVPVPAPA